MIDELATVYSTTHPADAEMAKLALENEGLHAYIEGEKQGGLTGVLAIRVCVAQADAERAKSLLSELDRSPVSPEEWEAALADHPSADAEGGSP